MKINDSWLPFFIKITYFTYFFGVGCVQTFYSVILKTVGLDNSQIGTVQGMGMTGGIIGPILIGIISDKTKKSKLILVICIIMGIVMHAGPIVIISFSPISHSGVIKTDDTNGTASSSLDKPSSAPLKVVILLTGLQLFATLFDQGTKSQLDGMVYKVIDMMKQKGLDIDYGKQRMFCPVGMCLASLVSGILFDKIKKMVTLPFKEELLLAIICLVFGAICVATVILFMPRAESKSTPMMFKEIGGLFTNSAVLMILILFLINQFAFNIIRHYEVLYVLNLGGSRLMSGICFSLNRCGEILMMYFSSTIIEAIGSKKVCIACCQLIFAVTVFIYSFADTPWISFNYAFLMGFTNGIQWPCVSRHVKSNAPPHLISSYISVLVTFGKIGAAISNKVGGSTSYFFGYRVLYMISASIYCLAGVIYMIYILIVGFMGKRKEKDDFGLQEEKYLDEDQGNEEA